MPSGRPDGRGAPGRSSQKISTAHRLLPSPGSTAARIGESPGWNFVRQRAIGNWDLTSSRGSKLQIPATQISAAQITGAQIATTRILIAGDVMLDRYWFGDVERISPEAPVPVVHVTREEYRLGGAGNVALNVASLGAQAALMSIIGEDDAAARLRALLHDAGIEPLLESDPTLPTTVKLRVSGRAQQLIRLDFEHAPGTHVLDRKLARFRTLLDRFDAVLLSDYGKGSLAHVQAMIALAREAGKPVLIDPKGGDYTHYRGATVITPNRAEFELAAGRCDSEAELEQRAETMRRDLALDAVLVTRSHEGMSLFDNEGHLRVPAAAREVFDVTGAGDTVIATLATLIASGMPLRDAVGIANRAAGIVVGRFGTTAIAYEDLFS
ncbi:D-glycero-beta-D-manno-heptose-7-phosphate kinase [Tsuneonella suprasediminis]|uniref:D-glycero-beta-D-manno-heptose-7-phosphate kinase n=1 Tax=Tsuneonella suprasediminis TaxID=2306996 RepID=A0A419QY28_9SPHN|nr:D-glycero-beta-D-manno-heptose-7-phosphate kinase [Tsuneonella suprasediminis]RJX65607.1 D-glycero-beta-D-manno-heptose-7-phosphate kinase [Tsuneonella suprasediminis]